MYWLNVSKLAEDFINDRVPERERFKYYLAHSIMVSVGSLATHYIRLPFTLWNALSDTAAVIILIVGVILCYRVNKNGDDVDFIPRMVCLGWPIVIILEVLLAGIAGIVEVGGVIMREYYNWSYAGPDVPNELLGLVYWIVLYWVLYKYMKLVSQRKKTKIQVLA